MSEVQLTEDQDIYETIRAGITEGGNSFEQARWVIDSLTDAGYVITRPTVNREDRSEDLKALKLIENELREAHADSDMTDGYVSKIEAAFKTVREALTRHTVTPADGDAERQNIIVSKMRNLLSMYLSMWETARAQARDFGSREMVKEFNGACAEGARIQGQIEQYFAVKTIDEARELLEIFGGKVDMSL